MLSQNRKQHEITGDGNCLFRCFSFYIYNSEEHHQLIRFQLTQYIEENDTSFTNDCLPLSVKKHVNKMKEDTFWGTNVEIKAAAHLFKIPVFVATKKDKNSYYWIKFKGCDSLPAGSEQVRVPKNIRHMEVIHLINHYNVAVTSNGTLSESMPY